MEDVYPKGGVCNQVNVCHFCIGGKLDLTHGTKGFNQISIIMGISLYQCLSVKTTMEFSTRHLACFKCCSDQVKVMGLKQFCFK